MLLSLVRTLQRWRSRLSLRVSWNHLPPLTTHGLALLAGTLLFKPQSSSSSHPSPSTILVPVSKLLAESQIDRFRASSVLLARAQGAGAASALCLLSSEAIKLWTYRSGNLIDYLALPASPRSLDQLALLLEARADAQKKGNRSKQEAEVGFTLVAAPSDLPLCESPQEVIYD